MKKNLIFLAIAFLVSLTSFSQDISGVYNTDYRQMTLNQIGNKVTGTYEGNNGKIQAILNGNRLVGTWKNSASGKSGNFEFIFNSDYTSFTGKYGYGNNGPTKKWNGTKTIPSTSTTIVQAPPPPLTNISGGYDTDYGKMILSQNGDKVTGTYEGANGIIDAILNGNRLTGTWRNNGNNKTGNFEFIFNSDFSAFTGKFGYNNGSLTKKWNGTKTISSNSNSVVQAPPPPIANIAGVFSTDYKQMTISQIGNKVTGTYEGTNGKIQGTLDGNRLIGTWNNNASGKTGNFEFIFNSDFSAFTGKYGYNNATPTKKWNGTKTKSLENTTIKNPTQVEIPINVYGSWAHRGIRDQDHRLNIWQEGNKFIIILSWIDKNTKIWKSYMGEGHFEGREMNFKVFPSVVNGKTIDLGYEYHYTISPDNNLISGYYSHHGTRNMTAYWYYERVPIKE